MIELCCERCGGEKLSHFFGRDPRGRRCWQNRCARCGKCSEYVPTRDEIEAQCLAIRAAQSLSPLNDEQEKAWRRQTGPDDHRENLDEEDWQSSSAA